MRAVALRSSWPLFVVQVDAQHFEEAAVWVGEGGRWRGWSALRLFLDVIADAQRGEDDVLDPG